MTPKERKQKAVDLAKQGYTNNQIAEELGVSRQRVYQMISTYGASYFRPITPKQCIYPNWRNWMNENQVSKGELLKRLFLTSESHNYARLSHYMTGRCYPQKQMIDCLLEVTGLTYEQLWAREGE